ncbi:MAG: hypothetical protein JXR91_01640 [Deltaproteobacteria bacterium]|nr:hypothetical protein [Deltaproteobacteria bacterium]
MNLKLITASIGIIIFINFKSHCVETRNVAVYGDNHELNIKAEAELRDLGYTPVTVKPQEEDLEKKNLNDSLLLHILTECEAAAMLQIINDLEIRVWVYDQNTNNVKLVDTVKFEPGIRAPGSVIVQGAELLRAELMKINEVKIQPEPEPEQQPALPDNKPSGPVKTDEEKSIHLYRMFAYMGPGVTYGFSKLPVTLQVLLEMEFPVAGIVSLNILGLVPTMSMKYENESGILNARNSAITMGFKIKPPTHSKRLQPWFGIYGGAQFISVSGEGKGDYTSNKDTAAAAVFYCRPGLDFLITERFGIFLGVRIGIGLPRQVVQLGEKIPFGNPLLGGSLGIKLGIF